MELHPAYGVSIPEKNWIPAPRYLLRRSRLLTLLSEIETGDWLEIGCGAGALLLDLSLKGFQCSALEQSSHALSLVNTIRKQYSFALNVYTHPQEIPAESFDCIGAFEVLEHINDDIAALCQWAKWLRKDGLLFISVPAHMHKWTATDTWAGHYRRYGKKQLIDRCSAAGLEVERCESYGFPMANMIAPFRSRMHAAAMKREKDSRQQHNATASSGTDRTTETKIYPLLRSLPGRLVMNIAFRLQTLFLNSDLGNGYIAVARKK